MTFEEYINTVPQRTVKRLDTESDDRMHAILGIVTESAEIADLYKKKLAYMKDFPKSKLIDELGDLFFYVGYLIKLEGIDPIDIFNGNYNKLKVRYPEGFDSAKAINPNKDLESKVFNNGV